MSCFDRTEESREKNRYREEKNVSRQCRREGERQGGPQAHKTQSGPRGLGLVATLAVSAASFPFCVPFLLSNSSGLPILHLRTISTLRIVRTDKAVA